MATRVYVTGMNSGQNPCAGLGIARCVRKGLPQAKVIGVEHWHGSSGFHDEAVDEALVLPPWEQINESMLEADLHKLMDDGHVWIPGLDMEIHWLAQKIKPHRHLLTPSQRALELTEKPAVTAIEGMGFRVPDYLTANVPDSEIHAFLRHHSWQCWLKSAYQDAKRVTSWPEFEKARENQEKNWKTTRLYVQRHIVGREETIAFAAYQGELLGAAHLQKCLLTPEGKTWAGRVTPLEPELYEKLKEVVRGLEWTGGGELEYVRDPDGQKWIIEWNPRFPAWIYGAAIAGLNLPARLVSRVTGLEMQESASPFPYFTRVVHEIPAKEEVGLPLLQDPSFVKWQVGGKKGGGPLFSSMPKLKDTLDDDTREEESANAKQPEIIPPTLMEEIVKVADNFKGESPARIHLDSWTRARFDSVLEKIKAARSNEPEIRIGYSVKTSPTDDHLRAAKERGFLAECISQLEVHRALNVGYSPSQVILNGPGKFWPLTNKPVTGLHMVFADSVEDFERILDIPGIASVIGFRIRVPALDSRFGNSLNEFGEFQRIVSGVRKIKGQADLGFHFHMPSWAIGIQRWMEGLRSLLLWCRSVERLTGVPVKYLDLGGGFYPGDVEGLRLPAIQGSVLAALPNVKAIYFELGRSLTQQTEALVSRVLDVRRTPKDDLLEIVVDASIAELPLARTYPHRVFYKPQAKAGGSEPCVPLKKGSMRILGRICMEDDILAHQVDLPETVSVGDLVIFGDSGAYERSMSYVFGRG